MSCRFPLQQWNGPLLSIHSDQFHVWHEFYFLIVLLLHQTKGILGYTFARQRTCKYFVMQTRAPSQRRWREFCIRKMQEWRGKRLKIDYVVRCWKRRADVTLKQPAFREEETFDVFVSFNHSLLGSDSSRFLHGLRVALSCIPPSAHSVPYCFQFSSSSCCWRCDVDAVDVRWRVTDKTTINM